MKALYAKEVGYYLKNPLGYIVIVLFSVFANFLFVKDIFAVGSASLRPFFEALPWLFMVFIPALAMRSIAEEKRANTIEVLLTQPISEVQIVLAKFLALVTLVAIGLGLTFSLPFTLSSVSGLYLPQILVSYLGALLLGSMFIAMSMFFSALTKNQVVAFLSSVLVLFMVMAMNTEFAASVLPGIVQDWFNMLAPYRHYANFAKGLVDLRALVYFLSFTVVFLAMTVIDLEKRD
jgi:ABC-2 type transport system permease protein